MIPEFVSAYQERDKKIFRKIENYQKLPSILFEISVNFGLYFEVRDTFFRVCSWLKIEMIRRSRCRVLLDIACSKMGLPILLQGVYDPYIRLLVLFFQIL